MHSGENVEVDAAGAQVTESAHHLVEAAAAAARQPVRVVDLAWPVDRDPDEELVLLEERDPTVVEFGPVRLDRVEGPLPWLQVAIDKLHRAPEELEAHQRRLAPLPCDLNHG